MSPLDPDLAQYLAKRMREDLDVWSNFWFWALVGSTIAVAIGIICEAPEVWQAIGFGRKTAERIRTLWYMRVRKIDLNGWERICPELVVRKNHRRRKLIAQLGFIGWTLVAVGVAGEGLTEYFVNESETNIREVDEAGLKEAQNDANRAMEFAGLNELEAGKLHKKAEDEATARVQLQGKVTAANERVEELRKANNKAAADLEAEERKRVELEKTVAPRRIERMTVGNVSTIDVLKKFAGTRFIIECIPDWETRRAASNIEGTLNNAGWKLESTTIVAKNLPDGVTVQSYLGPGTTISEPEGWKALHDEWDGDDIKDELIAFLIANDWQVEAGFPDRNELKVGEIRILVGFKPAPYFDPDAIKQFKETIKSEWPNKRAEEIRAIINTVKSEFKRTMQDSRDKTRERQQPKK